MRRTRASLELALREARSSAQQATAHYSLGLFHDNNGRYAEAVPHYEQALRLGLKLPQEAELLAWLASSLFKIKREADALERLQQSRDRNADARLRQFLDGLEKRIERARRAKPRSKKPVQVTEELPAGGFVNTIVRIGATVRRTTGPWTPTIHALLNYLEAAGFAESPRVLGTDDKGREILTFIDGQTIGWTDWPRFMFGNPSLTKLGSLLRRYHDAVRGFHPSKEAVWRNPLAPRVGEIIRHGDFSPFNTVWRGAKTSGGHRLGLCSTRLNDQRSCIFGLVRRSSLWRPTRCSVRLHSWHRSC